MALNRDQRDSETSDARLSQLYRESAREDSPRHLDAALMATARQAMTSPRPVRRAWWISWRVPLAFAALAVVSVSLVTLMRDEGGDRVARLEETERSRPSMPPLDAPAEGPRLDSRAESAMQPPAPRQSEVKRPMAEKPGSAVTGERRAAQMGKGPAASDLRDNVATGEQASSPASTSASADVAQYSTSPAAAPPAVAASAPRGRVESGASIPEERAPNAAAARSAAVPRPEPLLRRQEAGAGAPPDVQSRELDRHLHELEGKSVRAWLDRILRLQREGRGAEANQLLAEFRRRFPDEALPPEFR